MNLIPAITRTVIEEFARKPVTRPELAARMDQLTAREREVFRLIARARARASGWLHGRADRVR